MQPIIQVNNLVKQYGALRAVDGLSFEVRSGEVFGLLGPNGAGKTTTLACIEGLTRPDGGQIAVGGADPVKSPRQVKQRLGVQLQATALLPELPVEEQITLFMRLYGQTPTPDRVNALLERLALTDKRHALPKELSGGQQQRLALALALVSEAADIIILDEPTAGLDPQARQRVWEIVRQLTAEGRTVLLTTHYIEEAEKLCDRVGIMDHGRLLRLDTPRALVGELEGLVRVSVTTRLVAESVAALPTVVKAWSEEEQVHAHTRDVPATVAALHRLAQDQGANLEGLSVHEPNLEELFLSLTGRRIRA